MSDENTNVEAPQTQQENTEAQDAAARAAAEASTKKAADDRLTAIDNKMNALADTVKAALAPSRGPVQGNDNLPPGQVPAHFRNLLRQQGLTDADIDANAPIIVPFLSAMLATDGAVIASGIQGVRDEVEMVKAARNSRRFPYWNEVEEKIVEMREEAAKQGQYLSPSDAYKAAVAVDVQDDNSRIEASKAKRKADAASSSSDVSAQNFGTHHGSRPTAAHIRPTAMSAEDIASLPREERKKLFEKFGDLPIR